MYGSKFGSVYYHILSGSSDSDVPLTEVITYSIDDMKRLAAKISLERNEYVSAYDWRGRLVERWQQGSCLIAEGN